jgi:protein TonB
VRARFWVLAGVVSVAAHGAAGAFIETREPHKRIPRAIEMHMQPVAKKQIAKPEPKPEPVKPPPPPKIVKPKLVKKLAPKPVPVMEPEAPPPSPKSGTQPESLSENGLAVPDGTTNDGEPGTGTENAPPAPPAPPAPVEPKPAGKKFVPIYQVTRMPKAKHAVMPEATDAFRQAQREALVVVEVELDAQGRVMAAKAVKKAGFGLDEAAVTAARATEFEPAFVGDQPVPVRYQIPYRFKVH